jgi:2-octaprenyl-6-methoxyphenol hydroxylase
MTGRVDSEAEVVVVGGGPAGLTAALALAGAGVETALVVGPRRPDARTTALLMGSVIALDTLGVWERARQQAAPLKIMRIVDATRRLIRAPEVSFAADEIGQEAFGYNIENRHLVSALEARADEFPALLRIEDTAAGISLSEGRVAVRLAGGGQVRARLAVGADGRNSPCRVAAGITTTSRRYPQVALALNFSHTRPHRDTSTEFHTETGPFTLVPLPGQRSSLVCVVDDASADDLLGRDDAALSAEIERRSHSLLGKVVVEPGRGAFPLEIATAQAFAANRVALIGEAAHVIPPIGAQGLNLGLRDAAAIGEIVVEAHRAGDDVGAVEPMGRYDRLRRADVASRSFVVDALNRSLLSDFLPVQGLRGLGLYLVDRIAPIRQAIMREGIAPSMAAPRLMRGEAL